MFRNNYSASPAEVVSTKIFQGEHADCPFMIIKYLEYSSLNHTFFLLKIGSRKLGAFRNNNYAGIPNSYQSTPCFSCLQRVFCQQWYILREEFFVFLLLASLCNATFQSRNWQTNLVWSWFRAHNSVYKIDSSCHILIQKPKVFFHR